jgi:putative flippase GtrA
VVKSFIRFNVVGLSNTAIDVLVFSALIYMHLASGWAQAIGYGCGILNSFFWNKTWTFDAAHTRFGSWRFWQFLIANLLVLGVSTLWVMQVVELGYSNLVAKVSSFAITLPLSFLASKWALLHSGTNKD